MTLPTILTVSRLVIVPVMVAAFLIGTWWGALIALVTFIGGTVTDYLDGRIARSRGIVSPLGGLLDPMADAFLNLGLFASFVATDWMPLVLFAMVALRELFMHTFLRPYMLSKNVVLKAKMLGKLKTGLQAGVGIGMIVVVCALEVLPRLLGPYKDELRWVAHGFLLCVALLSVGSLYPYLAHMVSAREQGPSADAVRERAGMVDAFIAGRLAFGPIFAVLFLVRERAAVVALALAVAFEISNACSGGVLRTLEAGDAARRLLVRLGRSAGRLGILLVFATDASVRVRGNIWPVLLATVLMCCYVLEGYMHQLAAGGAAGAVPRLSARVASLAQGAGIIAFLAVRAGLLPWPGLAAAFYGAVLTMCALSIASAVEYAVASRRAIAALLHPADPQ
ncbi:MAG: CDP-alcohol phosphatidyltransferase family protein [Candidatus Brocadiia bacterium]|jgi:CDP-diacylglycerol--glycerol-3-phosphate 3-phosphatidyltransferase|nr:CDP-alcohol phosphatidyltransferase family protein [Candidatus Brocadiia bacterium]